MTRRARLTTEVPRLGRVAVEVLESIYQHRLLSTTQIHALHTPAASLRWTQLVLARLRRVGLAVTTRLPGGLGLWYVTERGAAAVETIPNRAENRRKLIRPEQAAGPLQQHTLAVNDVGAAFVKAARERGHDCGPYSWRHEIAHSLGPPPGRRIPDQLIADALLTYQLAALKRVTTHYRFLELDRATTSDDDLAAKLARYARLYRRTIAHEDAEREPVALWTRLYPVFPSVLVVLTHDSRKRLERRQRTVLAACREDPELRETPAVEVFICLLEDLIDQGPFAAIFRSTTDPRTTTDWLGTNGRAP